MSGQATTHEAITLSWNDYITNLKKSGKVSKFTLSRLSNAWVNYSSLIPELMNESLVDLLSPESPRPFIDDFTNEDDDDSTWTMESENRLFNNQKFKCASDLISFYKNRSSRLQRLLQSNTNGDMNTLLSKTNSILKYLQMIESPIALVDGLCQTIYGIDNTTTTTSQVYDFKSNTNLLALHVEKTSESLSFIFKTLRHIWSLSPHYSIESNLENLIYLITYSISVNSFNICSKIILPNILASNLLSGNRVTSYNSLLTELMNINKQTESIYDSVKDSFNYLPWELSKTKLFSQNQLLCQSIKNLMEVLQCICEVILFLGPDLVRVTGDSEGVSQIRSDLLNLLEEIYSYWTDENDMSENLSHFIEYTNTGFHEGLKLIETNCVNFIDSNFADLRSCKSAFYLLTNFSRIKSRPTINSKMALTFNSVVSAFESELSTIQHIHQKSSSDGCIELASSAYPILIHLPISYKLLLNRQLFAKIKNSFLFIKSQMPQLLSKQLVVNYVDVGKNMFTHETSMISLFISNSYDWIISRLKKSILINKKKNITTSSDSSSFGKTISSQQQLNNQIEVNMSNELVSTLQEILCLYHNFYCGNQMPLKYLSVALDLKRLLSYRHKLSTLIQLFESHISQQNTYSYFDHISMQVLSGKILQVQQVFRKGCSGTVTWNSLHIPEYIDELHDAIVSFINTKHLYLTTLNTVISDLDYIAGIQLLDPLFCESVNVLNFETPEDFLISLTAHMDNAIQEGVSRYLHFSDLLIRIEQYVVGKKTGSFNNLTMLYEWIEAYSFNAIVSFITFNLSVLDFLVSSQEIQPDIISSSDSSFNNRFIIILSSLNEFSEVINDNKQLHNKQQQQQFDFTQFQNLLKLFLKLSSIIVGYSALFPRWMHGSCNVLNQSIVASSNKQTDQNQQQEQQNVIGHYNFEVLINKLPGITKLLSSIESHCSSCIPRIADYIDVHCDVGSIAITPHIRKKIEKKFSFSSRLNKKPTAVLYTVFAQHIEKVHSQLYKTSNNSDYSFLTLNGFVQVHLDLTLDIQNNIDLYILLSRICLEYIDKSLDYIIQNIQNFERLFVNSAEIASIEEYQNVCHTICIPYINIEYTGISFDLTESLNKYTLLEKMFSVENKDRLLHPSMRITGVEVVTSSEMTSIFEKYTRTKTYSLEIYNLFKNVLDFGEENIVNEL